MTRWLELNSSWHLGAVRERVLPRMECPRCGLWAGATACPMSDVAALASLDIDAFVIPQGRKMDAYKPSRIVRPAEFNVLARAIEQRVPRVRGVVTSGMKFGLAHESTGNPKPPSLRPVQFVGLYGGVMFDETAYERLAAWPGLVGAEWLPVSLRPDRRSMRYRELVFPFAGRSPSWLWADEEHRCPDCGRQRHKWRGVARSGLSDDVTHFNVADFTTKFVVREDLAALLAEVGGPTLTFVPVDLHDD